MSLLGERFVRKPVERCSTEQGSTKISVVLLSDFLLQLA